jgi:hypothetical protein
MVQYGHQDGLFYHDGVVAHSRAANLRSIAGAIMSTRCIINFGTTDHKIVAKVYRHSDGYPTAILPDLTRFCEDVAMQTQDTRFDDPSYLAAKYVVWQAHEYARKLNEKFEYVPTEMLDFLGVGIVQNNPGDIDYEYFVDCSGNGAFPSVSYEER